MKLVYKTADGRFTVEFDCDTQQELFEELANFQEVFEDNVATAKVKGNIVTSDKVRFVVREDKENNKYYEKVCTDWDSPLRGLKKQYGCHKKGGGLFPRRMPEENKIPGLNNWYWFNKDETNGNGKNETKEVKEDTPF